jgi:hypothetical protein
MPLDLFFRTSLLTQYGCPPPEMHPPGHAITSIKSYGAGFAIRFALPYLIHQNFYIRNAMGNGYTHLVPFNVHQRLF